MNKKLDKRNVAQDKPSTLYSPAETGIENTKRIWDKHGVVEPVWLEIKLTILLSVVGLLFVLFLKLF